MDTFQASSRSSSDRASPGWPSDGRRPLGGTHLRTRMGCRPRGGPGPRGRASRPPAAGCSAPADARCSERPGSDGGSRVRSIHWPVGRSRERAVERSRRAPHERTARTLESVAGPGLEEIVRRARAEAASIRRKAGRREQELTHGDRVSPTATDALMRVNLALGDDAELLALVQRVVALPRRRTSSPLDVVVVALVRPADTSITSTPCSVRDLIGRHRSRARTLGSRGIFVDHQSPAAPQR
jgi:hypothetical protein